MESEVGLDRKVVENILHQGRLARPRHKLGTLTLFLPILILENGLGGKVGSSMYLSRCVYLYIHKKGGLQFDLRGPRFLDFEPFSTPK